MPALPHRLLIDNGAVIDKFGGSLNSTPLHWTVRQGHLPMVVQLMKAGADPTAIDGEGERWAISRSQQ